jgi:hypothetical protein
MEEETNGFGPIEHGEIGQEESLGDVLVGGRGRLPGSDRGSVEAGSGRRNTLSVGAQGEQRERAERTQAGKKKEQDGLDLGGRAVVGTRKGDFFGIFGDGHVEVGWQR